MGLIQNLRRSMQRKAVRTSILSSGFWFVDIPRTSSSAIRDWLYQKAGYPHGKNAPQSSDKPKKSFFPDHTPAVAVREILGAKVWNKIRTFSVVRNPFDRFASLYLYYRFAEKIFQGNFNDFCTFLETCKKWPEEKRGHRVVWTSQHQFLSDKKGNILVNHIYKYEEREKGLSQIAALINLTDSTQQILNPSENKPKEGLRSLFNDTTMGVVLREFEDDFDAFSYPKSL